ncbi:hypothetical protein ABIC50_000591 [Burkholderia sp. 567]
MSAFPIEFGLRAENAPRGHAARRDMTEWRAPAGRPAGY